MEGTLADFSDVVWQSMLDAASVEALMKATSAVSAASASVEDMIALVRLPRVLIEEAVGFAKQHAKVCLLSLADLPSMPVPDPWDEKRKADLEARISRTIGQVLRLAQKHWGFSKEQMFVSQYAASTELLVDLASQWEEGQRAYHKALQKCDAPSATKQKAATGKPTKKPRRKRRKSVEDALQELLGTHEGRREVLAAGSIEKIRLLVRFSHGAVAGSKAWKKTIKPMLDRLREECKYARMEYEERRSDRQEK
jgi:hypothetical protein